MSKMSNIDLTIQNILKTLKDVSFYIVVAIVIIVIAICIYGQADRDIAKTRVKETRLNTIESRLNEQMNYIHDLEADVDNLKEVL